MVSKRFQIKITPEERVDEKARFFKTNQIMEFVYDTSKNLLETPNARVNEVEIFYTCPTANLIVPIPVSEIRPRNRSVINGTFWNYFWVNVAQHERVDLIFKGISETNTTSSTEVTDVGKVDSSSNLTIVPSSATISTTSVSSSPHLGPSVPRAPPNSPFDAKSTQVVRANGSPLAKDATLTTTTSQSSNHSLENQQQALAQSMQRAFGNTTIPSPTLTSTPEPQPHQQATTDALDGNDVDSQSCASSSVVSKASRRERSLPISLESITSIWKVEDESDDVGEEYLLITGRDRKFRNFAYIKQFGFPEEGGEGGEKIMLQGTITQSYPEQPNLFTFHTGYRGKGEETFDMIVRCDRGKFVGPQATFTKKLVLVPYSFQSDSPIISSSTFYA